MMLRYFCFLWLAMISLAAADTRPNILFVIADDASRDSFGAYGSTYVETPGFDRIAAEGVLFEQAYNCNPKCAPARACLLTGRYSWQLEEATNHNPILSEKWKFYPFLLESHGYRIGYTGKGWGPGMWRGYNPSRGIDKDNPAGHPWNEVRLDPPYSGIADIDYAGNFKAFLDAAEGDEPFCFWLGTKEPHRSYGLDNWKLDGRNLDDVTVPAYYPDNETIRGDLADYAIEVEWFDQHLSQAIAHLEEIGELDNTIILVTSDHGMPFPRVKGQLYDDGFHVPFAVRWGDKVPGGRTVTDFITFPDLAPTLMEIAGLDLHPQMTGKSFLPQLLAEDSGRIDPERSYTILGKERHDLGRTDGEQLSVGYPVRAIRNDRFLYARNFEPQREPVGDPEYFFMNTDKSPTKSYLLDVAKGSDEDHYFQMSFGHRPEEELYDIEADPDCVTNLAETTEFQKIKAELWEQLQSDLRQQRDPRILGEGEIFDYYPNHGIERQQDLYDRPDFDALEEFYKQYPPNEIAESQQKWIEQYESHENIIPPAEALLNDEPEPDLTDGFTSLYNGENLDGWTALGGDCEFVADGDVITGTCIKGSPSTYLSTDRADYTDFIFSAELKWEVDTNTGVMFRASSKPGTGKDEGRTIVFGPQAEMEGFAKERYWSGGVYGQSAGGWIYPMWLNAHRGPRAALWEDRWNRITVRAEGSNIKTWLNGQPAAHVELEEYEKGFFSLQIHSGKEGKVHFRNIIVKEL